MTDILYENQNGTRPIFGKKWGYLGTFQEKPVYKLGKRESLK